MLNFNITWKSKSVSTEITAIADLKMKSRYNLLAKSIHNLLATYCTLH